jgi:hypothetical protein
MDVMSKRAVPWLAALLLAATSVARAGDDKALALLQSLNPCTVVAVQMVDDVDSSNAHVGDFFRFETINAVTVGSKIAIPTRTMGYGIVAVASAAGRNAAPGTLVLEPRYLVLPGGTHLGVVLDHNTSDLQKSGSSGGAPAYLGSVPFVGAAAGIFNYFHHGKNIEVKPGTMFSVFPSESPNTEKCQGNPDL